MVLMVTIYQDYILSKQKNRVHNAFYFYFYELLFDILSKYTSYYLQVEQLPGTVPPSKIKSDRSMF